MTTRACLTICIIWGLVGCDPASNTQHSPASPTEMKPKKMQSASRVVTIKGDINAKTRTREFLGIDASVNLERLSNNNIYVVASTLAKPDYDNGFNTTFELTYDTTLLKEDAKYYLRVTAQRGNTVWRNNVLNSGISNPYQDNVVTITVEAPPMGNNSQ